jgi:hypothetical protein
MNTRKLVASAVITGASLFTPVAIAEARPRLVLSTYDNTDSFDMKRGQRLDLLIKVDGVGELQEKCDHAGGWTKPRVFKAHFNFHEIRYGDAFGRCNDVDF